MFPKARVRCGARVADEDTRAAMKEMTGRVLVLSPFSSLREAEQGHSQQDVSHAASLHPRFPDTQIWITIRGECQLGMTSVLWTASY